MRPIVLDASALVEYLLGTARGEKIAPILEDPTSDLHAPALCDVEVVSALRSLIRARKIDVARSLEALEDYRDLPLERHGHLPLLPRALELRDNFSAYDAVYVALAEALHAEISTCDDALASAMRAHAPSVHLVG